MRVVINAAIEEKGADGGICQVLIGLIAGFSELFEKSKAASKHEIIFVTHWKNPHWLDAYAHHGVKIVSLPSPRQTFREKVKGKLGPFLQPLRWAKRLVVPPMGNPGINGMVTIPEFFESLNADVLHIVYPIQYAKTATPLVLSLFDLQHRYFESFVGDFSVRWREKVYPEAFQLARSIITPTKWVKEDMKKQYGVPAEKLAAVPLASSLGFEPEVTEHSLAAVKSRFQLPDKFFLFPAVTYEHKNHIALLEAISILERKGTKVQLICTGAMLLHWPKIKERLESLALQNLVRFLGFVSQFEMKNLFHLSSGLITPTLFEGGTLPILEALSENVPILCSDIAPNREYAGPAATYFDPYKPSAIAKAIERFIAQQGKHHKRSPAFERQAAKYSWRKTAEAYLDVYLDVAAQTKKQKKAA